MRGDIFHGWCSGWLSLLVYSEIDIVSFISVSKECSCDYGLDSGLFVLLAVY